MKFEKHDSQNTVVMGESTSLTNHMPTAKLSSLLQSFKS